MYTRLVAECISTDDSLIGLNREAGQVTYQPAGTVNIDGVNIIGKSKEVTPCIQCHDHFFQGSIAGAFTDTVNSAFYLPYPVSDSLQTIGYSHAQVIMAMNTDNRPVYIGNIFNYTFYQRPNSSGTA